MAYDFLLDSFERHFVDRVCDQACAFVCLELTPSFSTVTFEALQTKLFLHQSFLDPFFKTHRRKAETVLRFLRPTQLLSLRLTTSFQTQCISRAWLKYYELFSRFKFFKDGDVAFFNAELPGSSLSAFNHYTKSRSLKVEWLASSYLAEGKTLGDTYGFYKKFPKNWLMDPPNETKVDHCNGDCSQWDSIMILVQKVRAKVGEVNFYSHDAGVDLEGNFSSQEQLNFHLHLGCMYVGLATLKCGGSMCAKFYTWFLPETRRLLYLCAKTFSQVYLCKPASSGGANSEVYFVGQGFLGLASVPIITLERLFRGQHTLDFSLDYKKFEALLLQVSQKLVNRQCTFLQQDVIYLKTFLNEPGKVKEAQHVYQENFARRWLQDNPVQVLAKKDWL
jgi:23S rRNA U2552 (ribose-2'-O)-methylase RlmE/FtsJ